MGNVIPKFSYSLDTSLLLIFFSGVITFLFPHHPFVSRNVQWSETYVFYFPINNFYLSIFDSVSRILIFKTTFVITSLHSLPSYPTNMVSFSITNFPFPNLFFYYHFHFRLFSYSSSKFRMSARVASFLISPGFLSLVCKCLPQPPSPTDSSHIMIDILHICLPVMYTSSPSTQNFSNVRWATAACVPSHERHYLNVDHHSYLHCHVCDCAFPCGNCTFDPLPFRLAELQFSCLLVALSHLLHF